MTTINERINAILQTLYGGNATVMAKSTFIKRTTINSITGPDEASPRFDVLSKIGEISSPRISMEWLIRGTGNMLLDEISASTTVNSNNENTNINDGDTISRLIALLEEKDKQINNLMEIIKKKKL